MWRSEAEQIQKAFDDAAKAVQAVHDRIGEIVELGNANTKTVDKHLAALKGCINDLQARDRASRDRVTLLERAIADLDVRIIWLQAEVERMREYGSRSAKIVS